MPCPLLGSDKSWAAASPTEGAGHTPIPPAEEIIILGKTVSTQPGAPGRQVGSRGRLYPCQPHAALQPALTVTHPSPERQRRGWWIQTESSLECF